MIPTRSDSHPGNDRAYGRERVGAQHYVPFHPVPPPVAPLDTCGWCAPAADAAVPKCPGCGRPTS